MAVVKDGTSEIYHGTEPKSINWLSKARRAREHANLSIINHF